MTPALPRRRAPLAALGALLLAAGGCAADGRVGPSVVRGQTPDATARMSLVQAGFLGAGGGGSGVLTFRGQEFPFGVVAVGLGGIGASTVEAEGEVYNLRDPASFGGTYARARFGAALADRSFGEMWLQNQAGVIVRLRAQRTGLMLAAGGDAVRITMR